MPLFLLCQPPGDSVWDALAGVGAGCCLQCEPGGDREACPAAAAARARVGGREPLAVASICRLLVLPSAGLPSRC